MKLDDASFYGGFLRIVYAPEYESVSECRIKLHSFRRFNDIAAKKAGELTSTVPNSLLKQMIRLHTIMQQHWNSIPQVPISLLAISFWLAPYCIVRDVIWCFW